MDASDSALRSAPSLRTIARSAAGLAGVTGAYGVLALLGAFGPVACISESAGGEGVSSEAAGSSGVTAPSGEAADGCVSGIDYLLGGGGEIVPQFFAWPMVLLVFVALGVAAAWTGRRRAAWLVALVGVAVSLVGFLSIGWYFALPTVFLLIAAAALSAEARRGFEGPGKAEA
ncbi:hypothetical protein BRD15_00175 [Halobacteriales archaeon SW_6_65_15]|jgi:hypothetical protein|nr:MAG: hypothetical protein BRD15_00175 [Halobacteriales archaeon SW_6_65_15]